MYITTFLCLIELQYYDDIVVSLHFHIHTHSECVYVFLTPCFPKIALKCQVMHIFYLYLHDCPKCNVDGPLFYAECTGGGEVSQKLHNDDLHAPPAHSQM